MNVFQILNTFKYLARAADHPDGIICNYSRLKGRQDLSPSLNALIVRPGGVQVRRLPKGAALVRFVPDDIIIAIVLIMAPKSIENTIEQMRKGATIHFTDLANVCRHYFGEPRIVGSHHVYKMPWAGDPRVNIQNEKGKAKSYQVRQVIAAIDRLAVEALIRQKAAEKKEDKPKKK